MSAYKLPAIHWIGGINHRNGKRLPGWPCCCSGERCEKLAAQEDLCTRCPDRVTCKACLKWMRKDDHAERWNLPAETRPQAGGSARQRATGAVACADVAGSSDVYALITAAHQHWYGIGWPEDAGPIALLERALELLAKPVTTGRGDVPFGISDGQAREAARRAADLKAKPVLTGRGDLP